MGFEILHRELTSLKGLRLWEHPVWTWVEGMSLQT